MAYTVANKVKDGASVTVGASATNSVVSGTNGREGFAIQAPFMTAICIDLVCSAVTAATGITAKLQVRHVNTQTWADSKTAAITANGTTSIRLLPTVAADQAFLPLKSEARVVITTGAGDTATVDAIWVPWLQ